MPLGTACKISFSQVAETYDECIENTVIKLGYGILSGGLTAMILFRASLCTTPAAHLLRRMNAPNDLGDPARCCRLDSGAVGGGRSREGSSHRAGTWAPVEQNVTSGKKVHQWENIVNLLSIVLFQYLELHTCRHIPHLLQTLDKNRPP